MCLGRTLGPILPDYLWKLRLARCNMLVALLDGQNYTRFGIRLVWDERSREPRIWR